MSGEPKSTVPANLYRLCKIRRFRQLLPPPLKEKETPSPEILIFGDSFSKVSYGYPSLSSEVTRISGKSCNAVMHTGLFSLKDFQRAISHYKPKYVLLESTETAVYWRFRKIKFDTEFLYYLPIKELAENLIFKIETSPCLFSGLEILNSFRFRWLNEISSQTPVYHLGSDTLFHRNSVSKTSSGSAYYDSSQLDLEGTVETIKLFEEVAAKNNVHFIFLPIPAKIRNYPELFPGMNQNYHLLIEKMNNEKVHSINLLKFYEKFEEKLFLKSDTHWNKKGCTVTAKAIAAYLNARL
jgi:hypothetical protein